MASISLWQPSITQTNSSTSVPICIASIGLLELDSTILLLSMVPQLVFRLSTWLVFLLPQMKVACPISKQCRVAMTTSPSIPLAGSIATGTLADGQSPSPLIGNSVRISCPTHQRTFRLSIRLLSCGVRLTELPMEQPSPTSRSPTMLSSVHGPLLT